MECNKDEAIRAKQIAEKKMKDNDFEGARKIANKAKNLYPELENIVQLLTICDVHCSSVKRPFGTEKDWYGILQIENLADESTVKKQYRKLALILHPDKNRFCGAEGAFKLICEANAVLSDPSKKSQYDTRIKFYQLKNQKGEKNGSSAANQAHASLKQDVFWTCCPYCGMRYMYHKESLNKNLRCQNCSKHFVGYDLGCQHVTPKADPSAEKVVENKGKPKFGVDNKKGPSLAKQAGNAKTSEDFEAKDLGAQKGPSKPDPNAAEKVVENKGKSKFGVENNKGPSSAKQPGNASKVNGDFEAKDLVSEKVSSELDPSAAEKVVQNKKGPSATQAGSASKVSRTSNGNAANNRETTEIGKKRKRDRKVVADSSESCDISDPSDSEDVTVNGQPKDPNSEASKAHFVWRSSRKRQNVSYNEKADDDGDSAIPVESSEARTSPDGKRRNGNLKSEDSKDCNQNTDNEADCDASDDDIVVDCPDPEFSDFDKERDENGFKVNQFWALYDTLDGMPRFYAKLRTVRSSPFRLAFTWLEAVPINEAYEEWVDRDLPASCGSFKLGSNEQTSSKTMFSHQVHCEKGKKRGTLVIYPRKGEVWAIFKDWDINWSTDPENHQNNFKYEVVEILSDFVADEGIRVCRLDKVGGFSYLFQRISDDVETNSFVIGSNEVFKFAHFVPYFKMSGSEREGVPSGSFELDPAALPMNPDDLYYPSKMKMESVNMDGGDHSLETKPDKKKSKSVISDEKGTTTPKKVADSEGINWVRRSPRAK